MSTLTERMCRAAGEQPPNQDPENEIHYGFIGRHGVNPDAVEDIYTHGENLSYAGAVEDAQQAIRAAIRTVLDTLDLAPRLCQFSTEADKKARRDVLADATEAVWGVVEQRFNDRYEEDEDHYRYERDGYIIDTSSHADLVVIKSPFYALRGECSPCAPNGGHLTTGGMLRTYCLGHDWFDNDTAPYEVWRVADNARVVPEGTDCGVTGCFHETLGDIEACRAAVLDPAGDPTEGDRERSGTRIKAEQEDQ